MSRRRAERTARLVLIAACAAAAAACSSGSPRARDMSRPATAQSTPAASDRAATRAEGGDASPVPVPGDPEIAALNSRLLTRVGALGRDADLPVGPGDLIEISVFEVEELSKLKLRIPLRGTISLPLIGQVAASGRSAIELEEDIRARLQQKYIHDPQVSVFVHEHRSQRITLTGAVRRGGVYTITSPLRLADALALGEGLTDDADQVIYLIRRLPVGTIARMQGEPGAARRPEGAGPAASEEQVMVPIDLEQLAAGRDELNVPLDAGDVIHVPRAGSYYVGGSVERPGSFFLKGKTTVEQAIMTAGGPRKVADWGDIRIYRTKPGAEREILTFDLDQFEKGEGQAAVELQKNDVVIVGQSGPKAVFFGFLEFVRGMFSMSRGL